MVRSFRAGVLALAVLSGCNLGGPPFVISQDRMIAGQRRTVLVEDICANERPGNTDPCLQNEVTGLVRADIGPPFTIESTEVRQKAARLVLSAERAGQSMLTVTVLDEDGEEAKVSRLITAYVLDRVELNPSCTQREAVSPFLVPAGARLSGSWDLIANGGTLRADDYFPFEGPGVTFEKPSQYHVSFQLPPGLEAVTITSPADPAFRLEFQPFDVSAVRALRLAPFRIPDPLRVGDYRDSTLEADLERLPCEPGKFPVDVTVETPSICLLANHHGATPTEVAALSTVVTGRVVAWGKAPGTCRVTARLQGSSVPPATVEFTVSP